MTLTESDIRFLRSVADARVKLSVKDNQNWIRKLLTDFAEAEKDRDYLRKAFCLADKERRNEKEDHDITLEQLRKRNDRLTKVEKRAKALNDAAHILREYMISLVPKTLEEDRAFLVNRYWPKVRDALKE